jgi:hypothetical protein
MTDPFPDVCACGCGRPPAGSYWYSDLCLWTWLAKVNDPLKLDEPVRTFCGSTYTEQPPPSALDQLADAREEFAKFAETVKDELRPPLERTVGWLGRLLDRLGKGNQQ